VNSIVFIVFSYIYHLSPFCLFLAMAEAIVPKQLANSATHTPSSFYHGLSNDLRVLLYTAITQAVTGSSSDQSPMDIYSRVSTDMQQQIDPSCTVSDIMGAVLEARKVKNNEYRKQKKQIQKEVAEYPSQRVTRGQAAKQAAKNKRKKTKDIPPSSASSTPSSTQSSSSSTHSLNETMSISDVTRVQITCIHAVDAMMEKHRVFKQDSKLMQQQEKAAKKRGETPSVTDLPSDSVPSKKLRREKESNPATTKEHITDLSLVKLKDVRKDRTLQERQAELIELNIIIARQLASQLGAQPVAPTKDHNAVIADNDEEKADNDEEKENIPPM
jgi:hypothetical protein